MNTETNQPTCLDSSKWGIPSLSDINAYISAANSYPLLTPEEEQECISKYQENNDFSAGNKLILSHLRLVVSTARLFLGYGFQHGDLIQEGNIGLIKAVKKFDASHGARLASYAMYWIKSEIREYVLKNYQMVKMATTKQQRKLFFNLRSMKQRYKSEDAAAGHFTHRETLTSEQVKSMANELSVSNEDVIEMETRLGGGDVLLDSTAEERDEGTYGSIEFLSDFTHEPSQLIEARQRDILASDGLTSALAGLDIRSRRIIDERWLNVNDDSSGGMSLHELAAVYGVSAERIRQIESAALKKMKKTLLECNCFA